jgi:hypothetical protein
MSGWVCVMQYGRPASWSSMPGETPSKHESRQFQPEGSVRSAATLATRSRLCEAIRSPAIAGTTLCRGRRDGSLPSSRGFLVCLLGRTDGIHRRDVLDCRTSNPIKPSSSMGAREAATGFPACVRLRRCRPLAPREPACNADATRLQHPCSPCDPRFGQESSIRTRQGGSHDHSTRAWRRFHSRTTPATRVGSVLGAVGDRGRRHCRSSPSRRPRRDTGGAGDHAGRGEPICSHE